MFGPIDLLMLALAAGPGAAARDLVLLVAPRRASTLEAGRTKRIHRALVRLHPDAEVLTLDPVLSFDPAEARHDHASMRERLAWELTLLEGLVRTIVFDTEAYLGEDTLVLPPFGVVTTDGADRNAMRALGPLVGRLRPRARVVLLGTDALTGRLSWAEALTRELARALGAPQARVFGPTTEVCWPPPDFSLLRAYRMRRSRREHFNRGRHFDFGASPVRSRYLRLGVDDAEIFGCAPELEDGF